MSDLVIRGGSVVTTSGVSAADVAVSDGVIAAVGPNLDSAPSEIDATVKPRPASVRASPSETRCDSASRRVPTDVS